MFFLWHTTLKCPFIPQFPQYLLNVKQSFWPWPCLFIYLFYFHFLTVDLELHIYTKNIINSLYSNNIELININSVTEQEMESLSKEFLESMWTNWQTRTHTHTHTHTFVDTLIKETFKGMPPFTCSKFSGIHSIDSTCCGYIL